MKKTSLFTGLIVASVVTITLSVGGFAQAAPAAPQIGNYAEGLYAEYAAGTGGKISFQIATVDSGSLTSLQGTSFSSLLTVPPYRIETSDHGTELRNPQFVTPLVASYALHDMGYSVDKFQQVGYPLSDGTYRRLNVTASIGGDTRQHQAMEFCWAQQKHCSVLDPVVVFLQSKVDNRLRLAASGWGPRVSPIMNNQAADQKVSQDKQIYATCGLASHHNWIGETITWKAYTVTYSDIFGITLVTKHLGLQQYGMSCDASCRPAPYSRSDSSSASGTLGWTTACARTGGASGITSRTSREIAETKCTHEWAAQASASVTIEGSGASISASWKLGGGVDSNGGELTDTCSYF